MYTVLARADTRIQEWEKKKDTGMERQAEFATNGRGEN